MKYEEILAIAKELYDECISDGDITDPWYRASDGFFTWMIDFLAEKFDVEIEG